MTSPIYFLRGQDLLIKLVQILSPLTPRAMTSASLPLIKRFFVPPSQFGLQQMKMRSSVRIWTNFTGVQKEMGECLGGASEASEKILTNATKNGPRAPKINMYISLEFYPPAAKLNGTAQNAAQPISKQAQTLIFQVHAAIAKLTSSSCFKDPKQEPLRRALKKIRPHLDKIIETVSLEDVVDRKRGKFSGLNVPPAVRDHEKHPLVKSNSRNEPAKMQESILQQNQTPQVKKLLQKQYPYNAQGKRGGTDSNMSNALKRSDSKDQVVNLLSNRILVIQENRPENPPRPAERTYLPGAPYEAQTKNTTLVRKKKKRKGFLFKDEEGKHDHSN